MKECFIGPFPGFENHNLFSETPIVAISETEGARNPDPDGTVSIDGAKFSFMSFASISDAFKYRKEHESPDNVTTVKIYAFSAGQWRLVKAVAKPN